MALSTKPWRAAVLLAAASVATWALSSGSARADCLRVEVWVEWSGPTGDTYLGPVSCVPTPWGTFIDTQPGANQWLPPWPDVPNGVRTNVEVPLPP